MIKLLLTIELVQTFDNNFAVSTISIFSCIWIFICNRKFEIIYNFNLEASREFLMS